jgi:hypothetical protein
MYHFKLETWFRDLVQQGNGYFSCKYFNVQKWTIQDISSIQLDPERDICTVEDFEHSLK